MKYKIVLIVDEADVATVLAVNVGVTKRYTVEPMVEVQAPENKAPTVQEPDAILKRIEESLSTVRRQIRSEHTKNILDHPAGFYLFAEMMNSDKACRPKDLAKRAKQLGYAKSTWPSVISVSIRNGLMTREPNGGLRLTEEARARGAAYCMGIIKEEKRKLLP